MYNIYWARHCSQWRHLFDSPLPVIPNTMLTTYMETNWLSYSAIKRPQIPKYCCGRLGGLSHGKSSVNELLSGAATVPQERSYTQSRTPEARQGWCWLLIHFFQYSGQMDQSERNALLSLISHSAWSQDSTITCLENFRQNFVFNFIVTSEQYILKGFICVNGAPDFVVE